MLNAQHQIVSVLAALLAFIASADFRPLMAQQSSKEATVSRGQEIVGQACMQCHNLRYMQVQRKNSEQWRNVVYAMISTGALVLPEEVDPLVAYLTATFGPNSATPAASTPPGSASSAPQSPAVEGKILVERNCQQCHSI